MAGFGLPIIAFIIILGPLIFFHELGHFLAARFNGIVVEEFGIGFPPRMVTLFEQKGTKFTLNWLPLGGFMRPKGENDPMIEGGLANASKTARFTVLAAGPGANLLLGFLILVIMFMVGAPMAVDGILITAVEPNSPAEAAGLELEDIILEINGTIIDGISIHQQIGDNAGQLITLTVLRGEETFEATLTPRENPPEGQGSMGIQFGTVQELVQLSFFRAFEESWKTFMFFLRSFVEVPAAVIRDQIPARYLRPVSIIGISQLGGQKIDESIQEQQIYPVLQLAAYISFALAITNLLPLPALDGGRILFVIIEAVRGKRVDPDRETLIHFIGFAILLALMLVFVFYDIVDPLVIQ